MPRNVFTSLPRLYELLTVTFALLLLAMLPANGAVRAAEHPVPESPLWLTYSGREGPGRGKHIVLIAADQEYRSEFALPMLAKILAVRHGFDCTVQKNKDHPVLKGITDVWGLTDVYRTYKEGGSLPLGCTPLVYGRPLMGRNHDDPVNPELIALPAAWVKTWTGNEGKTAHVFHTTMGSAQDYQSAGLRRLTVKAVYWCLLMEQQIDPGSSVDIVGDYKTLERRLRLLPPQGRAAQAQFLQVEARQNGQMKK